MTSPHPSNSPNSTAAEPASAAELDRAQRRALKVLVSAQVLSGAGLAAGITVGALLAQDMLGSTALSGIPTALFAGGSALSAALIGRISHRWGRRPGLALGYLTGALGALGTVLAAVLDSPALLFAMLFVYGAGTATNLQARYAGADLAVPARRGAAVSAVLVATTLGAVTGPNLVEVMGSLAQAWGIPRLAGPFLLAATAYGLAALVLSVFLRPDPLLVARENARLVALATEAEMQKKTAAEGNHSAPGSNAPPVLAPAAVDRSGLILGATVMVVTQIVMTSIMTMTPVHMKAHGHGLGATGLVIAIHIGGMYLPAPFSGWLVDRRGPRFTACVAGAVLLLAGLLAALMPPSSVAAIAVPLALLGLGWSLGLIAGTTAVTAALPIEFRARTQGSIDVFVAIGGASAGALSGVVVAAWSYGTLGVLTGVLAALLIPLLIFGRRSQLESAATSR